MQQEGNECFCCCCQTHLLYLPTFITQNYGQFPLVLNDILCGLQKEKCVFLMKLMEPNESHVSPSSSCCSSSLVFQVALICVVEQRVDPWRAGMSVLARNIHQNTSKPFTVLQNYSLPFTLIPYMHFGRAALLLQIETSVC